MVKARDKYWWSVMTYMGGVRDYTYFRNGIHLATVGKTKKGWLAIPRGASYKSTKLFPRLRDAKRWVELRYKRNR